MKTIIQTLILLAALSSCNDSMGLKSPINKHLDAEIADRIARLLTDSLQGLNSDGSTSLEIQKFDKEVQGMLSSINLFDAAGPVAQRSDHYFDSCAEHHGWNPRDFITTADLKDKPEIIIGMKMNELAVLNKLLLKQKESSGILSAAKE